jgi:uncharacterized protein
MTRQCSNASPCLDIQAQEAAWEALLGSVRTLARERFNLARGSHDWDHTLRVARLCRRIGEKEAADMTVLLISAYLHDIGRADEDASRGGLCHAEKGAQLAAPIVSGLPLDEARQENILHCIRAHRFRGSAVPATIEARVLFDADKLDAIGAVGIARAFLFAGEIGACLHNPDIDVTRCPSYSINDTGYREFKVKLSKIRDRILTRTGRRIAEARHRFMTQFFRRFIQEFNGER